MSSPVEDGRSLVHQQQLLVIGFLGGIAFTALVLVLQQQRTFEVAEGPMTGVQYFDLLAILIAVTSCACIFGSFTLTGLAAGKVPSDELRKFAVICFLIGMVGLLVTLPLLLVIFTRFGATIIVALELILALLFLRSFRAPVN